MRPPRKAEEALQLHRLRDPERLQPSQPTHPHRKDRNRGGRERDRAHPRSDTRSELPPLCLTKETTHPLLDFASPEIQDPHARSTPR
ncbi:hypothetical protein Bca52824_081583 [Brassica carinata]|nr:hypothetical protein Bca52824_081583 [Brassica carinata]